MHKQTSQVNGWYEYKPARKTEDIEDSKDEEKTPCTCTKEDCGNGCFIAAIDFDRLDQQ